ncbi:MAG: putative Ig domain-containing protein [ANME-2 cluster archaeon]|nr:putative Ig domain-containing protein [ANME-2 cluster archaeon]
MILSASVFVLISVTSTIGLAATNESIVSINPSSNQIIPGETFTLTILISPATSINGAQFDLLYDGSLASVNSVTEGNLLNQDGAVTLFNSGTINNSAGTLTNVYGSILGNTSVSSQGTLATISMTAGSTPGILELNLTKVIISNSNSTAAPYTITNTTILIDTAPVMGAIGARFVDEENTLTFTISATDTDGDSLTYSAIDLPAGASFDPATQTFSWMPADGQAGTYMVTFTVTDGLISDSEAVTITVNEINHMPVITGFEPADASVFSEMDSITINVTATDIDGQALTYDIKIDGVTCSTGLGYVWKTDYTSAGAHTIEVTVSDGTYLVTSQNTITINNVHPHWDVNEDNIVNILDIALIGQKYGTSVIAPYPRWDVNQDGIINIQDLTVVSYHFGETVA